MAGPPVRESALRALRAGVELDDGRTSPARVTRVGEDRLEITIHEGRKRQVKRMCEHVGHPVRELERVRYGPLRLGDLAPGAYRRLSVQRWTCSGTLDEQAVVTQLGRLQGPGHRRSGERHRTIGHQAQDRELLHLTAPRNVEAGDRVAGLKL